MYYVYGFDETNPKSNNLPYKNANGAAVDDEDDDGNGISSIYSSVVFEFRGLLRRTDKNTEWRRTIRTTTTAPSKMIKNLIWEYVLCCCCCLVFRNIILFSTLFHTPSSILNELFGAARHRFHEGVRKAHAGIAFIYLDRLGTLDRWRRRRRRDGDGKMEQE